MAVAGTKRMPAAADRECARAPFAAEIERVRQGPHDETDVCASPSKSAMKVADPELRALMTCCSREEPSSQSRGGGPHPIRAR